MRARILFVISALVFAALPSLPAAVPGLGGLAPKSARAASAALTYVRATSPTTSGETTAYAICPSGTVVIGGGYDSRGFGITASLPSQGKNAWVVRGTYLQSLGSNYFTAYAVCGLAGNFPRLQYPSDSVTVYGPDVSGPSAGTAVASCPTGMVAIGGGFDLDDTAVGLWYSRPDTSSYTAWRVRGEVFGSIFQTTLGTFEVTSYGVCAPSSIMLVDLGFAYRSVDWSVPPSDVVGSAVSACPFTGSLLGGGIATSDARNTTVDYMRPNSGGDITANSGWQSGATSGTRFSDISLTTYAVCYPAPTYQGTPDPTAYCKLRYSSAVFAVAGSTVADWTCQNSAGSSAPIGFGFVGVCRATYGTTNVSLYSDYNDPQSWGCYYSTTVWGATAATAQLRDAGGNTVGTATIVPVASSDGPSGGPGNSSRGKGYPLAAPAAAGVQMHLIEVQVSGIDPGTHGVLIHEEGSCEPPDFESAGDGTEYGKLEVGEDGDALHTSTTGRLSLTEGEDALLDEDGAAIVLHRHGDRVACGELLLVGLPDAGGGGLAKSRSVPPGGDALLLGALAVLAGLSVRRRFVRP